MSLANHENEFQQKTRRESMVLVDMFGLAGATSTLIAGGILGYNSKETNSFLEYDILSIMSNPLDMLGPAALSFLAYGMMKEAGTYFGTKASSHVGKSAQGSAEREFNSFMRKATGKSKYSLLSKYNDFSTHARDVEYAPHLRVNSIKQDMGLARFGLHYRTVPDVIGNVVYLKGLAKQLSRPIKGLGLFAAHLPFLRKANNNIGDVKTLSEYAFNPEKLYSRQRDEHLKNFGTPESDTHVSPYHRYSQGDVNMLHLAALVGADPTSVGQEFRKLSSMQDPAIQAVFNNATDILDGLKKNTKALRKTMKALYESLGPLSQEVLASPNDFIASMKEWESLTFDIYEYGVKESANMSVRQLATETILELTEKIRSGTLSKEGANQTLNKLNAIASLKERDLQHNMKKSAGPLHSVGEHAEALASSLSVAISTSRSWPLTALATSPKQDALFSIDPSKDKLEKLQEMHTLLHGSNAPFPSPTIIQELCIDKLMNTIEKKLKNNLKENNPSMSKNTLNNKADEMMKEWHQRTAVRLSR